MSGCEKDHFCPTRVAIAIRKKFPELGKLLANDTALDQLNPSDAEQLVALGVVQKNPEGTLASIGDNLQRLSDACLRVLPAQHAI